MASSTEGYEATRMASFIKGNESWLAPRLSDGICNRLFQIVSGMYHAKLFNAKLVFYAPRIRPSVHSDCSVVLQLFPDIPLVWHAENHSILKEDADKYMEFKPLGPSKDERTVIEGYFQNWNYFPKEDIKLDFTNTLSKQSLAKYTLTQDMKPHSMWWIHVRLGDYEILPHHQCTTNKYWSTALAKIPPGSNVLLFSDSPEKAKKLIEGLASPSINLFQAEKMSAVETLYLMSQIGGGCIGTNSTFSWWGMYLSEARRSGAPCILPSEWHRNYRGNPGGPWIQFI